MTVRLPPELDAQLQKMADASHTSKHALIVQAVADSVLRDSRTRRVLASIDETSREYAEAIRRLEDA